MTNSQKRTAAYILLLIIFCILSMYLYALKFMTDYYPQFDGQAVFAFCLRQILRTAAGFLAGLLLTRHLDAEKFFNFSILLFAVPNLICTLPETEFNYHMYRGFYNVLGTHVYMIPFIYLGILLLSYLTAIRRQIGLFEYCSTFIAVLLLSCYSAAVKLMAVGTALIFAAAGTVMLFYTVRKEKISRKWAVLPAAAAAVISVCTVVTYYTSPLSPLTRRLSLILTGGRSDPAGSGFYYIKIREALLSVRLIGRSSFSVGNVPGIYFFSQTYWNLDLLIIALLGGWIAVLCIIAAQGSVIMLIIKSAMKTRNPLTRHLGLFIACLFSVRLAFSILSSTVCPLSNTGMMMFSSGWNRGIDMFLLTILYRMMRTDPQYTETMPKVLYRHHPDTDVQEKIY